MTASLGGAVEIVMAVTGFEDGLLTRAELVDVIRDHSTRDDLIHVAVLVQTVADMIGRALDEILADEAWTKAIRQAQRAGTPYTAESMGLGFGNVIARAGQAHAAGSNPD